MISQELFGLDLALPSFPVLKSIRAIGMSDSADYAEPLAAKFSYRNTFYHKEPVFDIVNAPESENGRYDFVIASEVFEHVAPPVEIAFQNAFRILKPHGLFFFTVPYSLEAQGKEHFPDLFDCGIAQLRTGHVMVNRGRDGRLEIFDNLVFHGGPGETLETRVFSEDELRKQFKNAGFPELEIYSSRSERFGIVHSENWSLPMTARKQPFVFDRGSATEFMEQRGHMLKTMESLQARIAEYDEWADRVRNKMSEHDRQLLDRTQWALELDEQLKEKTAWAMMLEKDVAHHLELAKRFQGEAEERTEWALSLQREVDALRAGLARIRRSPWTRAGRALRLVKE